MKKIFFILLGFSFLIFKPAYATVIYDGVAEANALGQTFASSTVFQTSSGSYYAAIIGPLPNPNTTLYFKWSGLPAQDTSQSDGAWLITDHNNTFSNYSANSEYTQLFDGAGGSHYGCQSNQPTWTAGSYNQGGTVTGQICHFQSNSNVTWTTGDYGVLYVFNQNIPMEYQISNTTFYDGGHYAQDWLFGGGAPGQDVFANGKPELCITTDATFSDCATPNGGGGSSTPMTSQLLLVAPTQATSIPAWNKFIFLAQASTTANYKITLRYWNTTSSFPTISEKIFAGQAYDSGGSIGWTSFVSVPWRTSFLPDTSSTYFWNASLFERVTSTAMGIGFWDEIAYTTGSVMYDPRSYVPGTTNHTGITPSSTFGSETIVYGQDNAAAGPQIRSDMARLFEVDCSSYSGSLFSSSTLDAIGCYSKKTLLAFGAVLFIPGQYVDTPAMLAGSFDQLKSSFPFSIFFSTIDDIQTTLAQGNVSSTLAIQVPMPGGTVTSTNITIASPTFARDQVGQHIWSAYANTFILGLGVLSISGIVAWAFFL